MSKKVNHVMYGKDKVVIDALRDRKNAAVMFHTEREARNYYQHFRKVLLTANLNTIISTTIPREKEGGWVVFAWVPGLVINGDVFTYWPNLGQADNMSEEELLKKLHDASSKPNEPDPNEIPFNLPGYSGRKNKEYVTEEKVVKDFASPKRKLYEPPPTRSKQAEEINMACMFAMVRDTLRSHIVSTFELCERGDLPWEDYPKFIDTQEISEELKEKIKQCVPVRNTQETNQLPMFDPENPFAHLAHLAPKEQVEPTVIKEES